MDPCIFQHIIEHNRLLREEDIVIVGVSAGPDSTALLCLLCSCSLRLRIIPVYVDHGLRPQESIAESEHVKMLADRFGLPFEHASVDAAQYKRTHGTSLEESCRILRYRVFEKIRKQYQANAVALGHTADDQAEEMLLRLFRGTGLSGLSGMSMKNGGLVRPLLHTPKKELLEYLDRFGTRYCQDSSNTDRSILRNRLRLDILPAIERDFNANIKTTLLRTGTILKEENAFLEHFTTKAFEECTTVSRVSGAGDSIMEIIDIQRFLAQHRAIRNRIAEKALIRCGIKPDFHHIERIGDLAQNGRNGMEHHLPCGLRVYVSGSGLVFDKPMGADSIRGRSAAGHLAPLTVDLSGDEIDIPVALLNRRLAGTKSDRPPAVVGNGELLLDLDRLPPVLQLRSPNTGERFIPKGMKGRKKVNRFFTDLKIAKQQRSSYPVLVDGENIVAVVGLRADDRFAADASTRSYLLISWLPLKCDAEEIGADR